VVARDDALVADAQEKLSVRTPNPWVEGPAKAAPKSDPKSFGALGGLVVRISALLFAAANASDALESGSGLEVFQ
jgi:hypothetical protein